MKMGKKGSSSIFGILIAALVVLGFLFILAYIPEVDLKGFGDNIKVVGKYIFGVDEDRTNQVLGEQHGTLPIAAIVITCMMMWLILFVAFGDIFSTFSAFSEPIAWLIAFALAVIASIVGVIGQGLLLMTKLFVWVGTGAVYVALLATILIFVIVNILVSYFSGSAKVRKAKKDAEEIEAGGKEAGAAASALGDVGAGLKKAGQKVRKVRVRKY